MESGAVTDVDDDRCILCGSVALLETESDRVLKIGSRVCELAIVQAGG